MLHTQPAAAVEVQSPALQCHQPGGAPAPGDGEVAAGGHHRARQSVLTLQDADAHRALDLRHGLHGVVEGLEVPAVADRYGAAAVAVAELQAAQGREGVAADKDTLLAQIRGVAAYARDQAAKYADQGTGYLENGGPFPRRLHLNLLIGRFLAEHYAALMRWAVWAQEEVKGWTGVHDASVASSLHAGLRDAVDMFTETSQMAEADGRTAPDAVN